MEGPEFGLPTPEEFHRKDYPKWSTEWSPYSARVGLNMDDSSNHVERVDMGPPLINPVQQHYGWYEHSTFGGILRQGGLRIGLTASGHAIALIRGQVAAYLVDGEALDWELADFGPARWDIRNTLSMCAVMGTMCSVQTRDTLVLSQVP